MNARTDENLLPVSCLKCGKLLAWAWAGAKVFCPGCKIWNMPEQKGGDNK